MKTALRHQHMRSVCAADAVAVEIVFEAVVAVDLPNGWQAGQRVVLQGASFYRLRDGLICDLVDLS